MENTACFRSGELELSFLCTENGLSLASVRDLRQGCALLSAPGALFTLTAERLSDGEVKTVRSDADFRRVSVTAEGETCVLRCSDCVPVPGLTVTLLLTADPSRSRVGFQTVLSSENPDYALTSCDDPTLWFDVGEGVRFLSPYGCGEALDSDSERFGHGYGSSQDYPSYGASFQFMAVWNERTGRCLYYGVHDPVPAAKKFHFHREVGAPTMQIKASQPLCCIDRPCNGQTLYGTCVWQLTDGDWYDAALLYRAWAEQNASWLPETGPNGRTDAGWLNDVDAWFLVHIERDDFADEILDAVKDLGVRCGVHLYLWHNNPFDNDYPHYFPEKPTVRRELRKLREAGVRVLPYVNGRLWDTRDRGTEDWEFTSKAKPMATKDRNGNVFTESYSAKEANGEHTVLAVMCPSTALWQETVKGICDRLCSDVGFDGVYLDQIAAAKPQPCADRTHNHLPGGGGWWMERYNDLLGHVSRTGDPAVLATECTGEPFMKHIQGYLSWLWIKDRQVPAFPVVYADRVITFGCSYQSIQDMDRDGLAIFFAQSLLFGEQMGWLSPKLYREMPERDFFRRLVSVRAELHRVFHGGRMLRPPVLSDDAPRLRCEKDMQAYFHLVDYPAVQGALWRDADGKRYLLLVNASPSSANVVCKAELPDGAYALHGDLTGELALQNGSGKLTLPPCAVVWVEA